MNAVWMRTGLVANGNNPVKQRWTCFKCKNGTTIKEDCHITTGLNEEPGEDSCKKSS